MVLAIVLICNETMKIGGLKVGLEARQASL